MDRYSASKIQARVEFVRVALARCNSEEARRTLQREFEQESYNARKSSPKKRELKVSGSTASSLERARFDSGPGRGLPEKG